MRKIAIMAGLFLTLLFVVSAVAAAAPPPAPTIDGETDWRTGEIEVCYKDVTPGYTIIFYGKTYKTNVFQAHDTWTATAAEECYTVQYFENGQTVWHYIVQVNPVTGEISAPSITVRQTPPLTAYIINWPDMLQDLMGAMQALNDSINDKLDSLANPSDQAMSDLADAMDGLKNALGAGQATSAGDSLSGAIDNARSGMSQPIVVDDGNGTFTGGSTGGQLPFPSQGTGGNMNLNVPNPDAGTDTELTFRIPITKKMDGTYMYIKLFTKEQMEKMKWLGLARKLVEAFLWILFGMWLVSRFSPQLKA